MADVEDVARLILKENSQLLGIRNAAGFLLFFPEITHFPGQDERFENELDAQNDLAQRLVWFINGDVIAVYHELTALRTKLEEAEASERDAWKRHDQMLRERAAVLMVKTTDGLTASEWVLRTALAEEERNALRAELLRVKGESEAIFKWLLGEEGEFQQRAEGEGAYWWRKELRERIAARQQGEEEGR